jgi:hypothetical protein
MAGIGTIMSRQKRRRVSNAAAGCRDSGSCDRNVLGLVLVRAQDRTAPSIEWPHRGGDAGQTKYSTAADITASNVHEP